MPCRSASFRSSSWASSAPNSLRAHKMWRDLLLVYGAYVLTAGSPGPSTMGIMGVAMRDGRRPAAAMAAGVVTTSFAWGLIAAMGLATLIVRYAQALVLLKIAGGAYLLWHAFKSAQSAMRSDTGSVPVAAGEARFASVRS
ncbi:LysE family translocator [Sphingobium algorifonticola]